MLPISYFGEKKFRFLYTGLIIAGGALVFLGILNFRRSAEIPGYWERTEGRVSYSERLAPHSYLPTVRFSLPSEREITSTAQKSFRNNFEENEEVKVYYDPVEPTQILVERKGPINYQLYLFFGITLAGIGFRMFIGTLMRGFRIVFIKENGRRIVPDSITWGEAYVRLPIRKRRVFFLKCKWTDPKTEQQLSFVGEPLPSPPEITEDGLIEGSRVYVYFLPRSTDKYVIEW